MRKFILTCSACTLAAFIFFSCTEKEEKNSEKKQYTVCLNLKKDVTVLPFPSTKSIPDHQPSEPRNSEENPSFFSRIEYVVYHKESGAIVKHQMFTEENSEDFGEYIYDELEAGVYSIVLLAHSTTGATLLGNVASFPEVSDSFYATEEVTVSRESEGTPVEIILKRIVARIEFVGIKTTPDNVAKFILEIEERYNTTNLKTGETSNAEFLRKEYPLSAGMSPNDSPIYQFYTFVPEPLQGDTSFLSAIKLITLDINEDTLHTIDLTAIPVMRNRITRYSGSLYAPNTNSNTLQLEIEDYGHWRDTINVPF